MRIALALLSVLTVALGGAVLSLHRRGRDLEERLAAVEARSPSARPSAAPAGEPALEGPAGSPPAIPADLAARVEDLGERVGRQEERVREVVAAVTDAGAPALGRPEFDDAVRSVVERMLADEGFRPKVAAAARGGALPKKPHIDALTKALELDDAQARRFREDLEDVQGQLFALLSEPAAGGPSWIERIAEVEALPEGDPKRAQVFLELMKARVPRSEETFLERAVALATEFRRRTGAYLRPAQAEAFAGLDVDLFGVKMD